MTREELKKVLTSKGNKLANEAILSIKSGEPLEVLEKIVEAGASDRYYYRDPLHPRSRYRVEHVLDSCFDSSFGVVKERTILNGSAGAASEVVLGHLPSRPGRALHFAYLLDKGFSPGSNGYRGELFSSILKSCFYRDPSESAVAVELASILIARERVDIQKFAENNYEWTGSEEKLRRIMSIGATPTGAMLDCALSYCACAQGPGDPSSGRADVIRALLDAGASPSKKIGVAGSSRDQHAFLESHGLASRIITPCKNIASPGKTATPRSPLVHQVSR